MSDWYVVENGSQVGPLTAEEVQNRFKSGRYTPDTLFWREGFTDWQRAGDIPELAGAARRPATAPPPLPTPSQTSAASPRAKGNTLGPLVQATVLIAIIAIGGWYKHRSGQHEKAVELYNGAVKWKLTGGSDSVALARYTEAIEADADFTPPYLNRGVIRIAHGDSAGGFADMERVVEIARKHPPDADDRLGIEAVAKATFNEGLSELWKGDTSAALAAFDSAIKRQRPFSGPHLERGLIALARHDTTSAQSELLIAANQDEGTEDSVALLLGTYETGMNRAMPTMDSRRAHLVLAILAVAHHDEEAARSHLQTPGMDQLPDAIRLRNALGR